jgi:AraC-like DNA-binding protein
VGRALEQLRLAVRDLAATPGVTPLPSPGAWVFRADHPDAMAKRSAYTLTVGVVVQGRKHVHIEGDDLHYDERHCIVLTGEASYTSQVVEASPERPYLSLAIAVPPDLVARTLVELAEVAPPRPHASGAHGSAFLARLDDGVLEPLCRFVRAMDDPAERRVVAPLAVHELVFRLLRSDAASALRHAACRGGDEARIAVVMGYIRENLGRKLTVEQLARRAAMSPSHFAHRFRDVARVSPIRYLKHVRLDHARTLLLREGTRAAEAATRSGYASAAHFARDFKQHFGHSPTAYVERMRSSGGASESAAVAAARPA